jgi:hypothetical protein
MTITLEAIRAAGGIVHSDGNIFFRDISMLQGLAGAAPAAVAIPGSIPTELTRLPDIMRDCGRLVSTSGNAEQILRTAATLLSVSAAPALEAPAAPTPVGEAGTMPGTSGFTMACFHADKVPLGTKLYTQPMAAAPRAPAAPSAVATQVTESLLQLARIVNVAVEDWGETKEDDSLHVIFHKEQADKLEEILDFLDSLPDAPPEEGVILSGPSRAARVLRAMEAPAAPAVDASDTARMDWLEKQVVNVRAPLRYGSRDMFWASPEEVDGGPDGPSDLRARIDAAQAAAKGEHDD